MDLLSPSALTAIKAGFQNVADTLYKTPIVIQIRNATTAKKFGEGYTTTYTPISINARVEASKASGERYINVDNTPKGKDFSEGTRVFIWREALDEKLTLAGLTVNPETDRVEVEGVTYEIRMFAPSDRFANIGPLLYEMDLTALIREGN